MERVAELAAFFRVPAMLCVNKFDLNREAGRAIEEYAETKNVAVVGRIPFDPLFTSAMVQGKTLFEYDGHSEAAGAVKKIWAHVAERLDI